MKAKGIRILDKINRIVCVTLPDILMEVRNGESLHWSILYLYSSGHLGEGQSIPVFEKQIYDSENGFFITWDGLNSLSKKFYQIIDITLLGSKNKNTLQRYENDQEMYETCDIVIEMIDSGYWEVFSKDPSLIARLKAKFKNTEPLEPNFEK